MPLYEYKCKKGHVFDVMQSFSEDPLTKCEICGAKAERVLSAPAIHFKGSGFYNTDYGTKRRSREKEASASESNNGSSGDSAKSDKTETSSSKNDTAKTAASAD
ncbi:MAG: zinc ribbon domain-containing protein [Solirubrobacterales bacterium]|nr:zinc ribbon domain-containing protein [Solirubrobacterales bacterium]